MANEKDEKNPSPEEYEQAAQFLVAKMRAEGVAVSSVKNGFLLAFKRATLQSYLDADNKEELIIFVHTPDPARVKN